ncbi:MAG: cyclic nucleotide-binding/CBS domain-containing protein [Blastococcus sp.]
MSDSEPIVSAFMRSATTTIEPDSHVASAAYMMKRAHDSALVVTSGDGRVPIAVITDADVSQAVADGRDLDDTRINQLHLSRPAVVSPGTSVAEAGERMLELGLMHLPVMDDGQLVGLVDMVAVCRVLLDQGGTT